MHTKYRTSKWSSQYWTIYIINYQMKIKLLQTDTVINMKPNFFHWQAIAESTHCDPVAGSIILMPWNYHAV